MKRNFFFCAALCLLLATMTSGSLLTDAWAKYVTTNTVGTSARVAKFDVVEIDRPYSGSKTVGWSASREQQLASAQVTTFQIPLFDYEYSSTIAKNNAAHAVSVKSSNNDLVVAPGIGLVGAPKRNPNMVAESDANDAFYYTCLDFTNNSEVTVRIKVEYDPANSSMPTIDSSGNIVMANGLSANLKPPIMLRAYGANLSRDLFSISEAISTTTFPGGFRNMYKNRANTAKATLNDNDHRTARAFSSLIDADGWITLQPGQGTGQPGRTTPAGVSDLATVGIGWVWQYATTAMTQFTSGGLQYGTGRSYGSGYWSGVDSNVNWQGYSSTAKIPSLGTSRENNIDRFDTMLAKESARRQQNNLAPLNVTLAFRITVVQAD